MCADYHEWIGSLIVKKKKLVSFVSYYWIIPGVCVFFHYAEQKGKFLVELETLQRYIELWYDFF